MSAVTGGGPAFPTWGKATGYDGNGREVSSNTTWSGGMTLRDWLAGQALSGELAAEDMGDGAILMRSKENADLMAARAYQIADAMLAARETEAAA